MKYFRCMIVLPISFSHSIKAFDKTQGSIDHIKIANSSLVVSSPLSKHIFNPSKLLVITISSLLCVIRLRSISHISDPLVKSLGRELSVLNHSDN